ncbi:FecCD family ABC transporter permease [Arsenicicoccus dermatophilus]|uniref:FecCD family ABC transporter permease n=1 Tax=Arsenicicoccus dermatophilus TaxID=1076331 RepID=UPI0039173CAE
MRPLHATALAGALLLAVGASLALGSRPVSLPELAGAARGLGDEHVRAVWATRVPRTGVGLVCGAALAAAGSALQTATRNPLGDPGMLGLSAGASAGIVTVITLSGASDLGLVGGAFAGALLATAAVMLLGAGGREPSGARLLLAGAVVSAALTAGSQAVSLRSPAAFEALRYWGAGSLSGATGVTWPVLAALGAGLLGLVATGRGLDALALGDETAASLGHRPARLRALVLTAVAALTAATVALAGPVAFVGLAVPHLARALAGGSARRQLLVSAALGPVVLLGADVLGRVVARPGEVPVGVVTAVLGGPLLLGLLRRRRGVL